ncbi:MAG: Wzz/FepE/Etk N-terminal domain-containing protein [Pseudomonadota bacterium]
MLDLRFYIALFIRRLPYFMIFTVAGAAIGVALAMTLPPSYQAQARLVVESEQIPDELAASTVRTEAREQLQIIEQRILTRDNLLEMANRLNIYADRAARSGERLRPDQIVSDLRSRISIRTTGGGRGGAATLVNVRFSAPSPRLAATVTNEVVTLMLQENVRMRTGVSGQTLEFFEQEVARLDEELTRRGAEIVAFQEANRDALPDSLGFRRDQLTAAQERLLQLSREEAALQDRRTGLVALYEATGNTGGLDGRAGGSGVTPAERELYTLKGRLAASGAVLSLDNPRIRVMRAQIAALEEQIAAEAQEAADAAKQDAAAQEGVDPGLSVFDIQLADLDNQLAFIAKRRAEIETEMAELQETIDATPNNAVFLDTLQRDFAATRTQYDQAITNRARAETGDIIEALSKGERISVIEQAVAPAEPTSPDRPRLIAASLGGSMLLAIGFIALLEMLNSTIRRPQDIVRQLEITPLGTLPFIRTRRDRLRRRVLLLLILSGVAGVIVGALWGVNEYVMPIDLALEKVMNRLERLPGLRFLG